MKVAIMSAAHLHVEAYVPLLQAQPEVEIVGLADDDTARGEAAARRHGLQPFRDYAALLAEQPDAVLVCSENSRHRALVELAAAAGAHVLCEKPLATTVEDARAAVDACERAGVILMTAFPMRFSAPLAEVRSRVASGALGRVYCVSAVNQGQLPGEDYPWFADARLAGGGALTDHIVHVADALRWFFGTEIVEVYAQSNRILYADSAKVETGGQVMLTFSDGVFASIDCSWSRPPYYPTWGGVSLEVVAEGGIINVDAFSQNLTLYNHDRGRAELSFWGSDSNATMLEEFIAAAREGRQPAVTGTDGLRAVEAVAAAYESARTGQPASIK